jgi:hypothetical protein
MNRYGRCHFFGGLHRMIRLLDPVDAPRVDDKPSDVPIPDQREIYSTCPAGMLPEKSLRDASDSPDCHCHCHPGSLSPGCDDPKDKSDRLRLLI